MISFPFILYIASISVSLAQMAGNHVNNEFLSISPNSPAPISSLHPTIEVVEKPAESSSHNMQQTGDKANQILHGAFEGNHNVIPTTPATTLSGIENSQNPLSAPSMKRIRTRNVFKEPTNLQDFLKLGSLDTFLPPGLDFLSAKELPKNTKQSEQSKDGKGIITEQAQQKDSSKRWKNMVTTNERQVGDPVALVLEKSNPASAKDKMPTSKTDLQTPYDKNPFINFDINGGGLQQIKYIPNNGLPFLDQFVHNGLMHNGISDSKTLPSNSGQSGLDLPWIEQDPWDITFRSKQVDSGTPLPWLDPKENKGKNVNTQNTINDTTADPLHQIDTAIESNSKQTGPNTLNSLNTGWAGWVEPSTVNDVQQNIKDSWISSSLQNKLLPVESSINTLNSTTSGSQGQPVSSTTSNTKSELPTEIVKTISVPTSSSSGSDNKNSNNFFATWDPWRTDIVSNPEGAILNNPTVFERRKGFIGESVASSKAQVDIVLPPLLDTSIHMKQQEEQMNRKVIENNSGLIMPSLVTDIGSTVNEPVQSLSPTIPDNNNPIEQTALLIDNTYNPPLVDNAGTEIQNTKEQIRNIENNHIEVSFGVPTSPLMDNFNQLQQNGEVIDKKLDNNSAIDIFVKALRENAFPVEPTTGILDKHLLDNNPVKETVTVPLQILYHENPIPNGQAGNVQTDLVSSPLINNFGTNSNVDRPPTDVVSTSPIQNHLNPDIRKVKVQAEIKDNKMTNIVGPILPISFQTVSSVNQTSALTRQPSLDNNPKNIIENFIAIKKHSLNNPGTPISGNSPIETSLPNENHFLTPTSTINQNTFYQKELNPSMQTQIDPMSKASLSKPNTSNVLTDIKLPLNVNSTELTPSNGILLQQNKEMKPQVSLDFKHNVDVGPKSLLPDISKSISDKSLKGIKPIKLDESLLDIKQSANQNLSETKQSKKQTESKSIKAKEIDMHVSIQKLKLLAGSDVGTVKPISIVNAMKESAPFNDENSKSQLRSLQFDSINKNTNKPFGYLTTHNSIFFDPKTNKAIDPFRQVTREVLENAKKAWTNAIADVGSSQIRVGFLPTKTTEFAGSSNSKIISPNRNHVPNNGQNLNFNSGDISLIDPITEGEVLRLNVPRATPRQRRFPLRQNIDPNLATAPDSVFLGPFLYGPGDHSSGDNIEFSGTLLVPVKDHASSGGNQHHQSIFIPNNNNKQRTIIHGRHQLIPRSFAGQNINNNERPQQSPVPNVNSRDRLSELSRLRLLAHHTNNVRKQNFPAALFKSFIQGQIDSRINANILSARKNDASHKIREATPQMLNLQANRRSRNPFSSSAIARRIPTRRHIQTSNILGQNRFLSANTGNRIRNRERNFVSRNRIIRPQINNMSQNQQVRQDFQGNNNNWIRRIVETIRGLTRRSEEHPSSSVLNNQFARRGHGFDMRNLLRNISVSNANSKGRSLRNIVPTRTTLSASPRVKTRPVSTILTNPVSRTAIPSHRRLIHKPSGRFWDFTSHSRTIPSLSGVPLRSDFVHLKPSSWLNNPTVPINQPPVIS